MSFRDEIKYNINLLDRELDPAARGRLRVDTPNVWREDRHALTALSNSPIIDFSRFEELHEDNKFIVAALVNHLFQTLTDQYRRKEVPKELGKTFLSNYKVMYVTSEDLWQEIIRLAEECRQLASAVTHPASKYRKDLLIKKKYSAEYSLMDLMKKKTNSGDIVKGDYIEEFMKFAKHYLKDPGGIENRFPIFDSNDLDSDDMHAFLCAYDTAFHQ
jgi:hypothetical protein